VANLVQDVAMLKKVLTKVRDHFDPQTSEGARYAERERQAESARQNLIKTLKNALE
jgi:hypothetical protein